ncbi:MAG: cysteine desulfurase [Ruminococcus sp.]|nr:cysteine desulfurase [Ruminococcus sp.]
MTEHYLDNSATTCVSEASAQKALQLMRTNYANPSSLHSMGFAASQELESARQTVAKLIGADSAEVYFTSGGTEANNLAIFGAVNAHKRAGNRIITSAFEHSSVYESMLELQKQGFEVVFIKPDQTGSINAQQVVDAVDSKTILVSVMLINNETGAINPIREIALGAKRKNPKVLIHTDAVQAAGKTEVKVSRLCVDMLTLSGHKIHAPKGVGALYIKKGVRILPRNFGGKQEKKLRPGTEALPLIGALGVAVQELDIAKSSDTVKALKDYTIQKLSHIEDITFNSPDNSTPYILNFSVKGIRSETMLHHLASMGVYVSSGSACSKGGKSHVLSALGLDADTADSAIRVSFSKHNTTDDCDALIEGITNGIENLARR